jgi:two-component system, LytTR family, sensor kinase
MESVRQGFDTPGPGRRQWWLILAFWSFMGVVETTKSIVTQELRGGSASFGHALVGNMPWWLCWAALTPIGFFIARRFPLDPPGGLRNLPIHTISAIVFTFVHLSVVGALYHATSVPAGAVGYGALVRNWLDNFGMLDFVTYWGIVGAWYVIAWQARFRVSQLNAAHLELKAAQMEAGLTEARLNALRAELNPHFLFNALNAISGLVRRQENTAAVAGIARLGDLLRLTLDAGATHQVPLRQELEYLSHYLDIERIRFHDRLSVDLAVSDDVLDVPVPTLILQPIVENALRHGIARKPGSGRITIAAGRADGVLRIDVDDTGTGLPEGGEIVEGVGLSNTRARLAQMYGDAARFEIGNRAGGGVRVTMELPAGNGTGVSARTENGESHGPGAILRSPDGAAP